MRLADPEALHRTLKLELDTGRAATFAEAEEITKGYRLHVEAGPLVSLSASSQATLLTVVATAVRCFLGGVTVSAPPSVSLRTTWRRGRALGDVLRELGALVTDAPPADCPTLAVGHVHTSNVRCSLYASVDGWVAHVSRQPHHPASDTHQPIAGVLAGALAVGELFQRARGDKHAGRRDLAVNLWAPGAPDRQQGPTSPVLPSKLWLVGLGHLGQAYAWTLCMLPFERPQDVLIQLQDTETVSHANVSTGLFSHPDVVGRPKTRVVANELADSGFLTRLVERQFDAETRPQPDEPRWVLGGLDRPEPRRWIYGAGFDRFIDAGIGDDARTYLDILVQTFPSQQDSQNAFPAMAPTRTVPSAPAYEQIANDAIAAGASAGDAQCGVIELAGRAVGAAFVGAAASCLVLADVLRALNGAVPDLAVVNLDLRSPMNMAVATNTAAGTTGNPGFTTGRAP